MKIVLMSMEENIFFREILKNLLDRGHALEAVILEKGTPRSAVMVDYLKNDFYNPPTLNQIILGKKIPVYEVDNLNGEKNLELLRKLNPDLILLGGSSRIIKPEIIKTAKTGILNSHPGLLPHYRGRDIVGWAIYNNDPIGATCHFIDEGVDMGPILMQEKVPYSVGKNLLEIRVAVMRLAAALMVKSLQGFLAGKIQAFPQIKGIGKTYGPMSKEIIEIVEDKIKLSKV